MAYKNTMLYRNPTYGFTFRIPTWWRPYLTVRSGGKDSGAEYALYLLFRYKGTLYGEVLTILAYRMSMRRWKRLYADSPLVPVAERAGRVFAAVTPEELPYAFMDPETGEYDEKRYGEPIRLMRTMVNEDMPRVLRSFRWADGGAGTPPKPYLSDRVTPGDRPCGREA